MCVRVFLAGVFNNCLRFAYKFTYLSQLCCLALSLSSSLSPSGTIRCTHYELFSCNPCVCVRVCINIFMQICMHLRRILFYKFLPRLPAHRMNAIVLVNALTFVFLISIPYTLTAGYLLYVPVDKVYCDLVGNAGISWEFGIREMKPAEFGKLLEAYEGKEREKELVVYRVEFWLEKLIEEK